MAGRLTFRFSSISPVESRAREIEGEEFQHLLEDVEELKQMNSVPSSIFEKV